MKQLLWPLYFLGALVVAYLIYMQLPPYIREGGYLVAGLIFLMMGLAGAVWRLTRNAPEPVLVPDPVAPGLDRDRTSA